MSIIGEMSQKEKEACGQRLPTIVLVSKMGGFDTFFSVLYTICLKYMDTAVFVLFI